MKLFIVLPKVIGIFLEDGGSGREGDSMTGDEGCRLRGHAFSCFLCAYTKARQDEGREPKKACDTGSRVFSEYRKVNYSPL